MNKQDGQEFTQLQNERQEDAEYMAQVRDLNDDKWGLTYDKRTRVRHGYCTQGKHPLYAAWVTMRQRCNNPNDKHYARYGGRGIRICPEWDDFGQFLQDIGPRPSSGHSLDRINNNGNYEPGNIRWATKREQVNNTHNNIRLTIGTVTRTASEWALTTGRSRKLITNRLINGWCGECAVENELNVGCFHKRK